MEVRRRAVRGADEDGRGLGPHRVETEAARERVHPVGEDDLIARGQAVEDGFDVVSRPRLDLREGERAGSETEKKGEWKAHASLSHAAPAPSILVGLPRTP